jgi:hypothetical protein
MSSNQKPDHILYIVIPGEKPEDKKRWVRFGAAWKASKGFSIKIEPAFTLFQPFSDLSLGVAMMPADDDDQSSNNSNASNRGNQRGGRR